MVYKTKTARNELFCNFDQLSDPDRIQTSIEYQSFICDVGSDVGFWVVFRGEKSDLNIHNFLTNPL